MGIRRRETNIFGTVYCLDPDIARRNYAFKIPGADPEILKGEHIYRFCECLCLSVCLSEIKFNTKLELKQ